MSRPILHDYYRSSAAYRVRIALNLKQVAYDQRIVNLGQSLDAKYDPVPFVPSDPAMRSHVLALALTVACDIHPLNNLRILKYLAAELGVEEQAKNDWYRHWVSEGLAALEAKRCSRRL